MSPLELIDRFAVGEFGARADESSGDPLAARLNALGEQLSYLSGVQRMVPRLDELTGVLTSVAACDFTQRATVRDDGEVIDELAAMVNLLSEELFARTVSREQVSNMLDALTDMVVCVDTAGHITLANGEASAILAVDPVELRGRRLDDLVPVIDLPSAMTGPLEDHEIAFEVRGFTVVRFVKSAPLHGPTGNVAGAVFVFRDLRHLQALLAAEADARATEAKRKELETAYAHLTDRHEELQRAQAELLAAAKMAAVGELVAGLAHELNNPVGIMLGNAQSLARLPALDPDAHAAAAAIERQAKRCGTLVRSLLDFSRHEKAPPQSARVDEVLAEVFELTKAQAKRAGVRLDRERGEGALPSIAVAPHDVQTALINLVSNALDATPEGGQVKVGAMSSTRGVELWVKDSGCGIAPEVLPRIFDPFFTTKPTGRGTGLGLSMTRKIVESSGGSISVESAPGSGTTFRCVFPARAT